MMKINTAIIAGRIKGGPFLGTTITVWIQMLFI
jgi:hypothetical protein